jgi:uncharacterized protein
VGGEAGQGGKDAPPAGLPLRTSWPADQPPRTIRPLSRAVRRACSRLLRKPGHGVVTATAACRLPDRVASGVTVGALLAINVADHLLSPPWWVRASEGVARLAFARLSGLTWAQLGLSRERAASGLRWALGAIGLVAAVYVVGVLVPGIRPAFQDVRYHLSVPDALFRAFVVIPAGTVVLEEIAFRSVLWGMLSRHLRTWQVLGTTSVLFGLWHILPSQDLAAANRAVSGATGSGGVALVVAGTVVFTTLGGLVFGELRRRSGSVLAPAGAHWATNALGVLFGLVAWRLAGESAPSPVAPVPLA